MAHGMLHDGFVQVVAALLARLALGIGSRGGEDPLPGPLAAGAGSFFASASGSSTQPAPFARSRSCWARTRSRCAASSIFTDTGSIVARSLSPLPRRNVIWLRPKSTSFTRRRQHSSRRRPAAVEQRRHQARLALHAGEHGAHLVAREHDRQPRGCLGVDEILEPRQLDAEDLAVEEEQRRERLVLRRGRDVPAGRERVQEGREVLRVNPGGIAPSMELVVAAHPAEVGLLGAWAEVAQAHGLPRALGEVPRRGCWWDGSRERAARVARPSRTQEAPPRPPHESEETHAASERDRACAIDVAKRVMSGLFASIGAT